MDFKTPVMVIGLGRSGTSLVMGLLHQHGVWVDGPGNIRVWNKKGDFVNKGINKAIIKWGIQQPNLADKIHTVIVSQGYKSGTWGFKYAVKREWCEVFNRIFSPTWVLVRRQLNDIYNSRLRVRVEKEKTSDYPAARRYEPLSKFTRRYGIANSLMNNYLEFYGGLNIWPHKLIQGDYSELKKILNQLVLPFSEEKCEQFIIRDNWHTKEKL